MDVFNENKSWISPVKIGLFDGNFDESHEDLNFADGGVFFNEPDENGEFISESIDHGTHVAGIMAAVGTNDKGINGIYPYGDDVLYGVSLKGLEKDKGIREYWVSSMMMKDACAELIVRNVKVINQSLGFSWQKKFDNDGNVCPR